MNKRVVITGIGPVSSIGIGKEEFFENIISHKMNVSHVPNEYNKNYKFKSEYYVPMPIFSLCEFEFSSILEKMLSQSSKLAVVGAKLALMDAGFSIKKDKYFYIENIEDIGVIVGTGFSNLEVAFDSYKAHLNIEEKNKYNRMIIPMMMTNASSSWISILFEIKGFNYTINAACASGTYAIGQAYEKIKNGSISVVLSGGVECLKDKTGATMRGFDVLNTLTKSENPMPFSKNRSGFLFNEGAGCILVLEEYEHAKKRNADIYAEIVGYECSSDAYNIVQLEESGENIEKLIRKLIGDKKIDYINSHGTGTIPNDEIEAKVIKNIFKEYSPYVNSTKGIIGHSIGASGAIEAGVTALSIKHKKIHGNNISDIIENLNIPKNSINLDIDYAISLSYGFGGHNGGLLLKRCT